MRTNACLGWECAPPAVGIAKPAGHSVGHGLRQSPAAPASTGRLWNGENSTSVWLPGIFPDPTGLLSSLALAPLPWPWDAHAPRQAQVIP